MRLTRWTCLKITLLLCITPSASMADDEVLWPQHPVRIDRSRQHYERLPARQADVDTRIALSVPFQFQVVDSARFIIGKRTYRLARIRGVPRSRMCHDAEAGRWSCGRMAAVMLGNLVRSQRLMCDFKEAPSEILLDRCQVRTKDIAAALVLAGLAGAVPGEGLDAAERTAREARAGIWRSAECKGDFDSC